MNICHVCGGKLLVLCLEIAFYGDMSAELLKAYEAHKILFTSPMTFFFNIVNAFLMHLLTHLLEKQRN